MDCYTFSLKNQTTCFFQINRCQVYVDNRVRCDVEIFLTKQCKQFFENSRNHIKFIELFTDKSDKYQKKSTG